MPSQSTFGGKMILKSRKDKITWQCRRGLLELDLIFNVIISDHLERMTEAQLTAFEKLLENSDAFLYAWLMESEQPTDKESQDCVQFILSCYQASKIKQ